MSHDSSSLKQVTIIVRQTKYVVIAGETARLECYTEEGGERVTLFWSRQAGLPPGTQQANGVLTITNTQPIAAGRYICTGTDTDTGKISTAEALLEVNVKQTTVAPTVTMEPEKITIPMGTTGTLRCVTTGTPQPTLTWSKSREQLSPNHQVTGNILRITQATMADRGIYVCRAENSAGVAQDGTTVEVEIPLQPRNLQAKAISPNEIEITWSAPEDVAMIISYTLYYNDSEKHTIGHHTIYPPTTRYKLSELIPDTVYNIQLAARSSQGEGPRTILVQEKTPEFTNCGGEFYADTGVIQLPTISRKGKELYEDNSECKWKINVPDGHHVVIYSEYFDLEASPNCLHDYVLVMDGSRNNTFCGKEHLVYLSMSNNLTVTFASDDSISGRGFKLNVTSVPNSTEGKCNSTILAIQGQDGDIWNFDKTNNCFYSLEAPEGLMVQITLKFITFGSTTRDEKRIVIRDGLSTHGDYLWNISSGVPLRKKSVCANQLFIEYHNEGSTNALRFYLTYSLITCPAEPTTLSPTSLIEGDNECGCNEQAVCVLQGFEKMCIPGSQCGVDICANGATCVNTRRGDQCFCYGGFTGKFCNETAGSTLGQLKFIEAPQSRKIKRGGQSVSLCRVENLASGERVVYAWYFKSEAIGNYQDRSKLRDDEGLLLINDFNEEFEGRYTCVARAGNLITKHSIKLFMDECFPGIKGPSDAVDYTGRTVTLTCSIEEAGDIWWEKDNMIIDKGLKFHMWQNKTIHHLRIYIVEEQDAGVYTCVANDTTGCSTRRSAKLTVQNWGKHETYCGKSYPDQINEDKASHYISMGSDVKANDNPWHVSLFRKNDQRPFCGGSLISQRFVVTAAHCITNQNLTDEVFKASVWIEFASQNCTPGGLGRGVKSIILHPHYSKKTKFDSDISLLELNDPVEYSLYIRPICLQDYSNTSTLMIGASRLHGKAVGCGVVYQEGPRPWKLQDIMLPYVHRHECNEDLKSTIYNFTDNMICAGYKKRYGDVCHGDSGGGFMLELPQKFMWVLAGIVSFGFNCNSPYHYTYFTNVGMFYDWIDSIAKFTDENVTLDFLINTSRERDPESGIMRVTNGSNLTSAATKASTKSTVGQAKVSVTTPTATPVCRQERVQGPCKASLPRYFYNYNTGFCEQFSYGGCQGNDNNFGSLETCIQTCNARREKVMPDD